MGKEVQVTAVSSYVLPESSLYVIGSIVVLSDAVFNSLPANYVTNCLDVLATVADPTPPVPPGLYDGTNLIIDNSQSFAVQAPGGHYFLITADDTGHLTTTDLGTSPPS